MDEHRRASKAGKARLLSAEKKEIVYYDVGRINGLTSITNENESRKEIKPNVGKMEHRRAFQANRARPIGPTKKEREYGVRKWNKRLISKNEHPYVCMQHVCMYVCIGPTHNSLHGKGGRCERNGESNHSVPIFPTL